MRKIGNLLTSLFVVILVLAAVLLVGVRLVGLTPYAVLSGSMEPVYPLGSLLYVRKAAPAEIAPGDPITFVMNEELMVATHRVVEVDQAKEHFITKGDANDAADGQPVLFKNLIGKPAFALPYLGYLANFISSQRGRYIVIAVLILFVLLLILPDLLKRGGDKEPDQQAVAHAATADRQEAAQDQERK